MKPLPCCLTNIPVYATVTETHSRCEEKDNVAECRSISLIGTFSTVVVIPDVSSYAGKGHNRYICRTAIICQHYSPLTYCSKTKRTAAARESHGARGEGGGGGGGGWGGGCCAGHIA